MMMASRLPLGSSAETPAARRARSVSRTLSAMAKAICSTLSREGLRLPVKIW